jgi:hypothetical protein
MRGNFLTKFKVIYYIRMELRPAEERTKDVEDARHLYMRTLAQ